MADSKLQNLPEETSPASTDLVYVVTDPGGSPQDRKVLLGNMNTRRVLHDFVADASYMGVANVGDLTSAAVWTITRITVATNGSTTTGTASAVAWDDRLTVVYS